MKQVGEKWFWLVIVALFVALRVVAEGDGERFKAAMQAISDKNYRSAKIVLTKLVEKFPFNSLYWFNLANTYYVTGETRKAIQAYRNVREFKSPLAPAAGWYLAKCYQKMGKTKQALETIESLRKQPLPGNLAFEIELERVSLANPKLRPVVEQYRQGKYQKALERAQKVATQTETKESKMMEGLILVRLKQFEKAEPLLSELAADSSRTEFQRKAQLMLDQLQTSSVRRVGPFSRVEFATGYNNNLFGDGSNENTIGRPSIDLLVSLGYVFGASEKWQKEVLYYLYWEEGIDLPTSRFLNNHLEAKLARQFHFGSVYFAPQIETQTAGRESFIHRIGTRLGWEKNDGQNHFEFVFSLFRNFSAHSIYNYLRGTQVRSLLGWKRQIGRFELSILYRLLADRIGDLSLGSGVLPLAYLGHGPAFHGGYRLDSKWRVFGGVQLLRRIYDNAAQPSGTARRDNQWRFFTEATRMMSARFRLFLGLDHTRNRSTLGAGEVDNKNYSQWITRLGLRWDLL